MTNTYRDQGDDIEDSRILSRYDHVGMMRSPHLWPHGNVLPLKMARHGFKDGNFAFLKHDPAHPCRVYMGVIGMWSGAEKHEDFPSFEAIHDAGWGVD